jgi:hypothetical protein
MKTRTSLSALSFLAVLVLLLLFCGVAFTQGSGQGARPTPTPRALPAGEGGHAPASPDALPDLIVESITLSPTQPLVNDDVTVEVTIKNIGTADVEPGNNFFLDFYVNPPTDELRGIPGDTWWGVQGALMRVESSAVFTRTLTNVFTDTASYNLYAQVDTPDLPPPNPLGWVVEGNEDNNVLGPVYVSVSTELSWMQKDHVDFFSNMASTLDVVPRSGTAGVPDPPGLGAEGDSALVLGVFDEPPSMASWGSSVNTEDYNMLEPDTRLNEETVTDQRFPFVHAATPTGGIPGEDDLVVAVWEDGRNGPTYGRDIYLRWSDDGGLTWNVPDEDKDRVNDDVGYADQKNASVAVAPSGDVVVVWQDHRGASFDIYVQSFRYDSVSGDLIRCHDDGHCDPLDPCVPTVDDCNVRVDTGAANKDQILPDIAVDEQGNFYVVWQDQRNNNDDIFAVRSYWAGPNLAWATDARIHDDPSASKQANPDVTALQGVRVVDIEYYEIPDPPAIIVTDVITEPISYVAVTWEDDREGDLDIYITYSEDGGETFVEDWRLNDDKPANTSNGFLQQSPSVAVNSWRKWITVSKALAGGVASTQIQVPVTTMHIAWQDFRNSTPGTNDDPDIFYTTLTVEPLGEFPWPVVFNAGAQQQVNEGDARAWQTGPVWQADPVVAATSSGLTLAESESYNAFVAWSDWRNYSPGDFDNADIYFRLFSTVGNPTEFVGGNNVMVNDNVRLYNTDFAEPAYSDYRLDMPPHARLRNPSIASTLLAKWPTIFGGYVYVVWDDDRAGNPFEDRNIYLTRSNMLFGGHRRIFDAPGTPPGEGERYGSGAFVSAIFDSGWRFTTWYTIDWHAVTDDGTYITLQTRMGNTPTEVLASDWYPQNYPYPDDPVSTGAPLQGYDAPGQHILDAFGNKWPRARYIQYRINFWARDAEADPNVTVLNTPTLYDVILHYEQPPYIYLPVIFQSHWP